LPSFESVSDPVAVRQKKCCPSALFLTRFYFMGDKVTEL